VDFVPGCRSTKDLCQTLEIPGADKQKGLLPHGLVTLQKTILTKYENSEDRLMIFLHGRDIGLLEMLFIKWAMIPGVLNQGFEFAILQTFNLIP
jgi:hypothetical protein